MSTPPTGYVSAGRHAPPRAVETPVAPHTQCQVGELKVWSYAIGITQFVYRGHETTLGATLTPPVTVAQAMEIGFFDPAAEILRFGDFILVACSDGAVSLYVSGIINGHVSVRPMARTPVMPAISDLSRDLVRQVCNARYRINPPCAFPACSCVFEDAAPQPKAPAATEAGYAAARAANAAAAAAYIESVERANAELRKATKRPEPHWPTAEEFWP